MPVYHLTFHAYGTWHEDHPKGYVQRGQGLKPPSPARHRARRALQKQPPARLDPALHRAIHRVGLTKFIETPARWLGLTSLYGSPIIARYDRVVR